MEINSFNCSKCLDMIKCLDMKLNFVYYIRLISFLLHNTYKIPSTPGSKIVHEDL